jgi:magnesium transporter
MRRKSMEIEEMKTQIVQLLEKKQYTNLRTLLSNINKADITVLLQELEIEDILKVFRLLPKDDAADVFAYLEPEFQEELINLFTDKELKEVIAELFLDDTVDLIEEMPANVVKRILRHVPVADRKEINEFLNYPQESAGSMMTNEFVDLKENMTVADALDRIKKIGLDRETIYTCYVLTMSRKLIGIITAKDLLLSERNVCIKDIMKTNIISVTTVEDQEDVAAMFNKYDIIALPVVDKENRLVGIITIDDAIDVIEEETTEDFELMTGITPTEDSYFRTSVFTHSKNRVIWLFILMFSATITGLIITKYENAIASIPLLVAFIPMLMSTARELWSTSIYINNTWYGS